MKHAKALLTEKWANLSIRAKIILAFFSLMIVSTTTVTFFSYGVLHHELTEQVGKDLEKQAKKLAQEVEHLLIDQVDKLKIITLSQVF